MHALTYEVINYHSYLWRSRPSRWFFFFDKLTKNIKRQSHLNGTHEKAIILRCVMYKLVIAVLIIRELIMSKTELRKMALRTFIRTHDIILWDCSRAYKLLLILCDMACVCDMCTCMSGARQIYDYHFWLVALLDFVVAILITLLRDFECN